METDKQTEYKPITEADITDEMLDTYLDTPPHSILLNAKGNMAAAVNAYLSHK